MKITFRGWRRVVYRHKHTALPVIRSQRGGFRAGGKAGPIKWCSGTEAYARLNKLALSGDFLVQFEFDPEELRNWLSQYIKSDPEAAARLIGEMQGEVMVSLSAKAKADAVSELTEEVEET